MKTIEKRNIIKIFDSLNSSKVEYILIRNINSELPCCLQAGKDIDILVKNSDSKSLENFFKKNCFCEISHPHRKDTFLYGVDKFRHFHNKTSDILFDLNFQLACRSLNAGEWIPLDQSVQESAWKNRRFIENEGLAHWVLSYEDEFIMLIARSVFDKREFKEGYIKRMEELWPLVSKDDITEKLSKIFFKYTLKLLGYLKSHAYADIIKNYIKFREY